MNTETINTLEQAIKKDLENITKKEVDIMIKKYANPIILHRAQKDMVYVTQ